MHSNSGIDSRLARRQQIDMGHTGSGKISHANANTRLRPKCSQSKCCRRRYIYFSSSIIQLKWSIVLLTHNLTIQFLIIQEVTNEQEEYAQPFVDALNNLRNSEKAQQPIQHNNVSVSEYTTAGTTGAIVMNPAITTTSATTSTVLSKAGMSGGSLIYTNLGKKKYYSNWTPASPAISFSSIYLSMYRRIFGLSHSNYFIGICGIFKRKCAFTQHTKNVCTANAPNRPIQ